MLPLLLMLAGGWTGAYAEAYRTEYAICRIFGPAAVRREYDIDSRNPLLIALEQSRIAYRGRYQRAAFAGCFDGFRHKRPAVKHLKPWRA